MKQPPPTSHDAADITADHMIALLKKLLAQQKVTNDLLRRLVEAPRR